MTTPTTFKLGDRQVSRMGYGTMQLAGPMAFGPPQDRSQALKVLRRAVELGVNHIDTSDFYGPHITNDIVREALHPYNDDLTIVSKVGVRRSGTGDWLRADTTEELTTAVEDNLRNLKLDVIDIVNYRAIFDVMSPAEGSIEAQISALAALKERGLIKHIGVSNVTPTQVQEARRLTDIVCVQNLYNIAHRNDDALIDDLSRDGIAYVPFFPLGGFAPVQADTLNSVASELAASPLQVALAWLLQRAPNILLIPGTSSPEHLEENIAARDITLSDAQFTALSEA